MGKPLLPEHSKGSCKGHALSSSEEKTRLCQRGPLEFDALEQASSTYGSEGLVSRPHLILITRTTGVFYLFVICLQ